MALPIVYLTLPGNFIIAMLLTQTYPLGEALFGVIVSLPAWCNVVQLLIVPLLTRFWPQKMITVVFSWLHLLVWIGLGIALPFIPTDDVHSAGRWFLVLFGLSSLFHSLVGVAWTSWVQEWVPGRLRGKYFGRRNRLLQLSTIIFLIGAGDLLTRLKDVSPLLGYQIIIIASVLLRLFSIFAQHRILATSPNRPSEGRTGLMVQMRLIAQSKPLLWLFGFGAAFGLTAGMFGPFFTVFMYEGLGMTVADVSVLLVIHSVTAAIAMPTWGQFLDRQGSRPTMMITLVAWMLPGYCWAVLTPDNTWILKLVFASAGIFSAGFVLGQFNLLLKLVPPAAKTVAISLSVAVTSIAAAIAPIIGGLLLDRAWIAGFERAPVFHAMGIVHHTLIMLSGLVLLKVVEPQSAPLSQAVGAMRSYRQIVALLGMSFLVNYVFTKKKPGASE